MEKHDSRFEAVIRQLIITGKEGHLFHSSRPDISLPSVAELGRLMSLLKEILFPGYFGDSPINSESITYTTESNLRESFRILSDQINRGFCFFCQDENKDCTICKHDSKEIGLRFIEKLPGIRQILATDALAAFNGDPAAGHISETVLSYPSMEALTHYRCAHELLKLGVPLIPRMICEISHSKTGIDIHPEAKIGESFFIDHGTGVVIGQTCIIGNNVRIYQGVTLGARSFPKDSEGNPVKGIPRHPIIGDDVVIYANATILGRVTIGRGAVIAGNMLVTEDVEPGVKILEMKVKNEPL